jgi:molybdate transport system substrate-binding protein
MPLQTPRMSISASGRSERFNVLHGLFALGALLACNSHREPASAKEPPIEIKGSAPTQSPATASQHEPVQVAAASDLTRAFNEIGAAYEAETKQKVVFSFSSSGLLAQQIRQGAPFDLFAAANVTFADDLSVEGVCDGSTESRYARGKVVVWTKKDLVEPPKTLAELKDARFRRIAIANPAHAPYGAAAKEALLKLNLWDAIEPRIVYGENIKQTLQYAESGNAEAAIVALALVIGTQGGVILPIDASLHNPIEQALVVCRHGKNAAGARAFSAFVQGEKGRAIMQRYGFELPAETP